jgi:ParB family chromosome partitioning protein
MAEALGKSRSHIANLLRLLSLPDEVLTHLREGRITAGHARALITTENPAELCRQVVARGLSVREVERLAKGPGAPRARPRGRTEKDADTRALETDLAANLGMRVAIDHRPGTESGVLSIGYDTLGQLDELCRLLTSMPRDESI